MVEGASRPPGRAGVSGARARSRWLSSTALIFYALVLGVALGHFLPAETYPGAYETFRFLSKAFISLIKMLIVPLIFSTIVVGIGKTGDVKAVGRMGVKALIYFEVATTIALVIGLVVRAPREARPRPEAPGLGRGGLAKPKTLVETLLHLFPSNVVDAMAKQDILQVVIFATLLGVAAAHVGRAAREALPRLLRVGRRRDVQADGLRHGADAARRLRRDGGRRLPPRDHGPRVLREARRLPLRRRSSSSRSSSSSRRS